MTHHCPVVAYFAGNFNDVFMRKRIKWENVSFNLPYQDYEHIRPKPGHIYCLVGEEREVLFRVAFKFAFDLGYRKVVRFYTTIPENTGLWKGKPNPLLYVPNAWHLSMIDCTGELSNLQTEQKCEWLLRNMEKDIIHLGTKVILVDTIHFCTGRTLTHFLKSINSLARKHKVAFFIAANPRVKFDFDNISYEKPLEFKRLYLNVNFFFSIMKRPKSSDYYIVKKWKSRTDLPQPRDVSRTAWRYSEAEKVHVLWLSNLAPLVVRYHSRDCFYHIYYRHINNKYL